MLHSSDTPRHCFLMAKAESEEKGRSFGSSKTRSVRQDVYLGRKIPGKNRYAPESAARRKEHTYKAHTQTGRNRKKCDVAGSLAHQKRCPRNSKKPLSHGFEKTPCHKRQEKGQKAERKKGPQPNKRALYKRMGTVSVLCTKEYVTRCTKTQENMLGDCAAKAVASSLSWPCDDDASSCS